MNNALQAAIEAVDAAIPRTAEESSLLVAAKCKALMRGYDARWANAGYRALTVEQIYQAPLFNPDSKKSSKSQTYSIAGKLDVVAELNGRTFIIDHKTTSQDVTDPNSPYWRQLVVEGQVTHYMLLQWQHGVKVDGAVWDCIRKPSISPRALSKAIRASIVSSGEYCGFRVTPETRAEMQTGERENLELYECRLSDDCSRERPEWYFARRPIPRTDQEILEYAQDLWGHGQDMLFSQAQIRKGKLPPRNSGACLLYNSPCQFLGICSGHDTPDSERWRQKEATHPELPGAEEDGKSWLTNSRVRCFQTCRRKEYYQYQLGIERHDEDEREALFFGTTIHLALQAWWECFLVSKQEDTNHVNGID